MLANVFWKLLVFWKHFVLICNTRKIFSTYVYNTFCYTSFLLLIDMILASPILFFNKRPRTFLFDKRSYESSHIDTICSLIRSNYLSSLWENWLYLSERSLKKMELTCWALAAKLTPVEYSISDKSSLIQVMACSPEPILARMYVALS